MVKIIVAPEPALKGDIFLGGGISECPDWQTEIIDLLKDTNLTLLNPRRPSGLEKNGEDATKQILWEYNALRTVPTIVFWFPEETLCPITLFELGVFTQKPEVKLVVGTHPNYKRRFDVIAQLKLSRPEVTVRNSIADLAEELKLI